MPWDSPGTCPFVSDRSRRVAGTARGHTANLASTDASVRTRYRTYFSSKNWCCAIHNPAGRWKWPRCQACSLPLIMWCSEVGLKKGPYSITAYNWIELRRYQWIWHLVVPNAIFNCPYRYISTLMPDFNPITLIHTYHVSSPEFTKCRTHTIYVHIQWNIHFQMHQHNNVESLSY